MSFSKNKIKMVPQTNQLEGDCSRQQGQDFYSWSDLSSRVLTLAAVWRMGSRWDMGRQKSACHSESCCNRPGEDMESWALHICRGAREEGMLWGVLSRHDQWTRLQNWPLIRCGSQGNKRWQHWNKTLKLLFCPTSHIPRLVESEGKQVWIRR